MSRAIELIAAFDAIPGKYLRDEMEEAVSLQEEITPFLIDILEKIAADPEHYIDEGHIPRRRSSFHSDLWFELLNRKQPLFNPSQPQFPCTYNNNLVMLDHNNRVTARQP